MSRLVDEFISESVKRREAQRVMRKRRSVGIVGVRVRHRPQPLYMWDVVITDKRDEFPAMVPPSDKRFPLVWQYSNIYTVDFPVPRGSFTVTVHYLGGMVMIRTPGQGWNIHGQVGKYTPEELATLGDTPDGDAPGTAPESPSACELVNER